MQKHFLCVLALSLGMVLAAPTHADPKADKLLAEVTTFFTNLHSISLQEVSINTLDKKTSKQVMTLKLQKPNKAVRITTGTTMIPGAPADYAVYADGETLWTHGTSTKSYSKEPLILPVLQVTIPDTVAELCFMPNAITNDPLGVYGYTTHYVGTATVDGVACEVVEVWIAHMTPGKRTYYIEPDKMLRRVTSSTKSAMGFLHWDEHITQIKINPVFKASEFVFTPPPGAKADLER